ncbi:putative HAD superfamily hydrolase [Flavobacterium sp. 28A]|uniref:DUF6804 family protein n=1 Tax=Flavobacterium sp. 28A TaxID=2735895 RepID=UPI001D7595DD|nr:putative HAD superfamily hydrolase [Flavobacterium sp. 28A]
MVRFAAFVGFGILTYHENQQRKQIELIIFGAMALLYQPFLKIILRRELWNNIDEIIEVGLMVRLLKKQNDE